MVIDGKVHCLFEQSGTFKNEFVKLGYAALDYDIAQELMIADNSQVTFDDILADYEK